jgi:23S rRNA (uracil1939-C5)-methyltransferase
MAPTSTTATTFGVGTAIELTVGGLAAGGDGVGRDDHGRVTFVPRVAPGDRVRARVVQATTSFARGELIEVIAAGPSRVAPPCPAFVAGCGGCQWQHVARAEQLAQKHAIVAQALRKLAGVVVEPIADPGPPLGWRRRARFHAAAGQVGLYAESSRRLLPLAQCPQLEPGLDAALAVIASSSPPDGDIAIVRGHQGHVAIGIERPWRGASRLVGRAGIVGATAGDARFGEPVIEIEPGLYAGPWDFAQASAPGNAALIAIARAALGKGPGRLLELHAGSGNFTRGFVDDGWDVLATDVAPPARFMAKARFEAGAVEFVLGKPIGQFDALVLDPPRTGAAEAIDGIVRLAPQAIVYISCDPATLARDAARLVAAGYRAERAWPVDLMPQTAHVETVLRLVR